MNINISNLLWACVNTNWLENKEPTPEEIKEIELEIKQKRGREVEFKNSHERDWHEEELIEKNGG